MHLSTSDSTPGNGPDRKGRILDAAARVIAEQGVDAFTFRAVATEANVPLGSTTYYFKDRDDLLVSTLRAVSQESTSTNEKLLSGFVAQHGAVAGLARFIEELTVHRHDELLMHYRLYATALYRPSLQPEIATWSPEGVLQRYFDARSSERLGYLIEGIFMQAVVNQRKFFVSDVLPLLVDVTPLSD